MSRLAKYQVDSEPKIKRLIKVFVSLHYYAFLKIYNTYRNTVGRTVPGTFVILIYHSVKDKYRDRFSKQMDAICRAGHAVPADYSGKLEKGANYIAVTFDDGYQNIIDNALPEMRKRNIPATIFLTTGYLGKKADWVVDEKSHNYGEAILTGEQIKKLHESGVSFGSHTVSHPLFETLDSAAMASEIRESKDTLEQLLSKRIAMIALPYGSGNKSQSAILKDAGYQRVFLNVPRRPNNASGDLYYGRQDVKPDDWAIEYNLKFRGAYEWVPMVGKFKTKIMKIFK